MALNVYYNQCFMFVWCEYRRRKGCKLPELCWVKLSLFYSFFVKLQLAEKLLFILLNHRADFSCCTIRLDFWGGGTFKCMPCFSLCSVAVGQEHVKGEISVNNMERLIYSVTLKKLFKDCNLLFRIVNCFTESMPFLLSSGVTLLCYILRLSLFNMLPQWWPLL